MQPINRVKDIQVVPIGTLVPHPKNPNMHPPDQIERLADIIQVQGWRRPITVSKQTGLVIVGHGRLEAARLRGWTEVPVTYQDYENEDLEYADMVADNAIDDWASLDLSAINANLENLGPDFELDLLGIKDFALDMSELEEGHNPYTKKIEIPIYEPRGDKPKLSELYDMSKTEKLITDIENSQIPEIEKEFLRIAAYRHTKFDYENIAEFYAHATPATKDLMECSALVIIDFDKAIENGFVQLTKNLAELYQDEVDNDEE
jgi:hypothetical protein